MNTSAYHFNVQIESESIEKAREALTAMLDLKKKLSHDDLVGLAKKIKNNPSIIKTAKTLLGKF